MQRTRVKNHLRPYSRASPAQLSLYYSEIVAKASKVKGGGNPRSTDPRRHNARQSSSPPPPELPPFPQIRQGTDPLLLSVGPLELKDRGVEADHARHPFEEIILGLHCRILHLVPEHPAYRTTGGRISATSQRSVIRPYFESRRSSIRPLPKPPSMRNPDVNNRRARRETEIELKCKTRAVSET